MAFLKAKYNNGGQELKNLKVFLRIVMVAGALVSLALILLYLAALYLVMKMTSLYECFSSMAEMMNAVMMVLGFVLVYTGILITRLKVFHTFKGADNTLVIAALICVGGIIVIVSFIGYVVIYRKIKVGILIYCVLCLLALVATFLLGTGASISAAFLKKYLMTNCYKIMPMINESTFKEFQCHKKYVTYAPTTQELTCPKKEMRIIWEDDKTHKKDNYGCLNGECCSAMMSWIR